MGRKSKLSDKQWQEIERRLIVGEKPAALAKEYGVDRAAISRRFAQQVDTVKAVANQLVAAETAFRALPIAQQISARTLADRLKSISDHLAGAAELGAATAHRLNGIANDQAMKVDDADPLKSAEALKGIAVLTRVANDSASIALNLLAANKDKMKADDTETPIPGGLEHFYGRVGQ